ncbi:MAG: alpha/beta hydrolase [Syntrophaceae bacterium]|nr:alpha/beta hydrolase [Syntrophaceae bacterium]
MPFVSLPDMTMHYERAGDGETAVVCVHGNIASWRWWLPVLENPPAGCTLYAPDMRGFGESAGAVTGAGIGRFAADLDEFLRRLALPALRLVGHSLGAAVALQYALDHPGRVESLMLVSPPPPEGMPRSPQADHAAFGLTLPRLAENTPLPFFSPGTRIDRAILSHLLTRITPGMDHRGALFAAIVEDASRVTRETIQDVIDSLEDWNVRDRLPALDLPVVILWGDRDRVVPREPLERMAAELPQAAWIVWEGVGHAPQLERPEAFRSLLADFASEAARGRRPAAQRWWQRARKLWDARSGRT